MNNLELIDKNICMVMYLNVSIIKGLFIFIAQE